MNFAVPGRENFQISYHSTEDGGGTWFGQEYVTELQRYNRRFGRCLEWCSGPGFIGFALLAHGICDDLILMDHHRDRVQFYNLDRVSAFPDHERFDLVVANPPHYLVCPGDDNYQRIAVDPDWQAHEEFYGHIGNHLNPDGMILMQENQAGSLQGPAEFLPMIERNGLRLTGYWTSPQHFDRAGPTQIYYMEIRQK